MKNSTTSPGRNKTDSKREKKSLKEDSEVVDNGESKATQSKSEPSKNVNDSKNPNEIKKFVAMAESWWDPNGPFKPLHEFNPVRLAAIKDLLVDHFALDDSKITTEILRDLTILDIGCGGGLVCEPMYRMGASITGIDAARKNIEIAKIHAKQTGNKIDYQHITVEELLHNDQNLEKFDVILNLEVVEHVNQPLVFLENCTKLLQPNGLMVVATLNRTLKAFMLAIVGAEYILGWLPRRTHDFDKFIKPKEIFDHFAHSDYEVNNCFGFEFQPFQGRWQRTKNTDVNYMLAMMRKKDQNTE